MVAVHSSNRHKLWTGLLNPVSSTHNWTGLWYLTGRTIIMPNHSKPVLNQYWLRSLQARKESDSTTIESHREFTVILIPSLRESDSTTTESHWEFRVISIPSPIAIASATIGNFSWDLTSYTITRLPLAGSITPLNMPIFSNLFNLFMEIYHPIIALAGVVVIHDCTI